MAFILAISALKRWTRMRRITIPATTHTNAMIPTAMVMFVMVSFDYVVVVVVVVVV